VTSFSTYQTCLEDLFEKVREKLRENCGNKIKKFFHAKNFFGVNSPIIHATPPSCQEIFSKNKKYFS
jgi:aspartyl/asparaginyl-tRNA synthetase